MTTRDEAGSKASAQAVLPSTSIRTSQQSIVTQFMDLRKVRLLTTEEEQLFREAMNALNEEKKLLEEQKNQDKICKEERKEQEKICQEECKEQELACKERGEIRASTVQLDQQGLKENQNVFFMNFTVSHQGYSKDHRKAIQAYSQLACVHW